MTEAEELQTIKAVVAKPTEEGWTNCYSLMERLNVRQCEVGSGQRDFGNRFRDLQAKKQMRSLLFGPKLMGWLSTGYSERPRTYWRNQIQKLNTATRQCPSPGGPRATFTARMSAIDCRTIRLISPRPNGKLFRLYFWEAAKVVSPNT